MRFVSFLEFVVTVVYGFGSRLFVSHMGMRFLRENRTTRVTGVLTLDIHNGARTI